MRRALLHACISAAAVAAGLTGARGAAAAPKLRVVTDQKGDFVAIGNTLGQECAAGTPAPFVGTIVSCGTVGLGDSAHDVFWRADEPAAGQAQASTSITPEQARTTAVLTLPPGATVTHAYLYWGARRAAAGADGNATIERPGAFSTTVDAVESFQKSTQAGNHFYQSVADVTALVQEHGSGPYRVGGIETVPIVNVNDSSTFAGWWMVVLYENPAEPVRNIAVFDGLDVVGSVNPQTATLSGFVVPNAGFDAKLGVVAYEGDASLLGDQLLFNGMAMSDAVNAVNNFFNSSRSAFGNPVSVEGDLPRLSGAAKSVSGLDLDVVDVKALLKPGDTSATIQAVSTGDQYFLGGFITSIATFSPDLGKSTKTATDVNGGALLAGDVIEYVITVSNQGNDVAVGTVLVDALPEGVTFVPGSIQVVSGANAGAKTDAFLDDQGEYDPAARTVTVRLGAGAGAMQGGTLAVGEETVVSFQVTVGAGIVGEIANQANIVASGEKGAPETTYVTDGNGDVAGAPPTTVVVDGCGDDSHCVAPTPACDTGPDPNLCVGCLTDAHCGAAKPTCDPTTKTCTCVPSGDEVCDGVDNDCNGTIDDGCADTDGDGLTDVVEEQIGTDPNDADSDDDGAPDGAEPSFDQDSDKDGVIDALDPDSDDDGVFDGTELGLACDGQDTDPSKMTCVPDGDMGATKTSPVDADTDDGTVSDGVEDADHDGVVDPGEKDPNDPTDDLEPQCETDADCGGPKSGVVCDDEAKICIPGCRGTGNGCPDGKVCTSKDDTIGECITEGAGGAGGGGGAGGAGGAGGEGGGGVGGGLPDGGAPAPDAGASEPGVIAQGGGCNCALPEQQSGVPRAGWLAAIAAAAALLRRRMRRVAR